jgi:hypothetical protein
MVDEISGPKYITVNYSRFIDSQGPLHAY